jgi:tetratricopeptide (TPR) repeat protein
MGKRVFPGEIFFLAAVSIYIPLLSEELPPRTLSIRVAVDRDIMALDTWLQDIRLLLRDAFFPFSTRFRIQIKAKEIIGWDPESDLNSPLDLLSSLEKKVSHAGCDVVLAFASPRHASGDRRGIACCCFNYVLIQYLNSKRDLEFIIQHEICHLFGAVDLVEKKSIMSSAELGYEFDSFTSKIILLNRTRPFYQASPLFATESRDDFISLFEGRAALNLSEEHVHEMLALLYFDKGDHVSAAEQCTSCLAINPESLTARTIFGKIHLAQGDIDKAISDYQEALILRPGFAISHHNLAVALFKKGKTDEAIAEFQEAIKAKPDLVWACSGLASAYIKKGELDLSLQACRRALNIAPNTPEALDVLALGLIFKWKGLYSSNRDAPAGMLKEAILSCQKSLALEPASPETHNLLGMAYTYSRKPDLAETEYRTALELKPDLAMARLNLALLYFKERAIAAFRASF